MRSYKSYVIGVILVQLGIVLTIIVCVFLAEEAVGMLETVANANARADISSLPLVMAYRMPEVIDLALPLALLIAVYKSCLELREGREFVALAASRVSVGELLWTLAGLGIVCTAIAIVISGIAEPSARNAQRELIFDLRFNTANGGLTADRFHVVKGLTIFADRTDDEGRLHKLFVLDNRPKGHSLVITAANSTLTGPDVEGSYNLNLSQFRRHIIPDNRSEIRKFNANQAGRANDVFAESYQHSIAVEKVATLTPRAERLNEWTLIELLKIQRPPGRWTYGHGIEAVRLIMRALLCFVAPAFALIALSMTVPFTRLLALPVSCAFTLAVDVVINVGLKLFAPFGDFGVGAFVLAVALGGALAWAAAFASCRTSSILRPQLDQS